MAAGVESVGTTFVVFSVVLGFIGVVMALVIQMLSRQGTRNLAKKGVGSAAVSSHLAKQLPGPYTTILKHNVMAGTGFNNDIATIICDIAVHPVVKLWSDIAKLANVSFAQAVPATEEQICKAEMKMGMTIPEEVKALLMVSNGIREPCFIIPSISDMLEMYECKSVQPHLVQI